MQEDTPLLRVEGLVKRFPGVVALGGVSFDLLPGEVHVLLGENGAGKSTLIKCLAGVHQPDEGVITVDGDPVVLHTTADAEKLGIATIHQEFNLVTELSVAENVMLGLLYRNLPARERRDRARSALEQVGLERRLDALPTTMSGGERQRVAIARALVGHPAVLLCDEPTGNLDSHTTGTILDILDALHAEGITIVAITHEESVARRGTRTIHITDGALAEPVRP